MLTRGFQRNKICAKYSQILDNPLVELIERVQAEEPALVWFIWRLLVVDPNFFVYNKLINKSKLN